MTILEKPTRVLDLKGQLCPIPVIRTSQEMKQLSLGGTLEILTTDPGSKPDLIAWARMTGNELIDFSEYTSPSRIFRFLIRRIK
jgi:tRNA 2-thiouridine synthesizing protein A